MGSPAPAADNYFESLGLGFDPFAREAMPGFFFVGGQRRYLAQRAVHLLYFSGAMVLLLGERESGKTRLLDEIATELREIADICRVEATVLMDATELRALLANAIGLPPEAIHGAADFLLALRNHRPGAEEPLPAVLMIDAAHLLSIEALAETVALVKEAGGRLRLLLAGEAELATSWLQANAGAAETLQLPAFDRQGTADYLHTRLQAAGASAAIPLDDAVLDELFAQSGGNIGAIHALAPQLVAPQRPARPQSVAARAKSLPLLHIGAIAALLALVILLVLYRGGSESGDPAATADTRPKAGGDQRSIPLALPGVGGPSQPSLPAPAAAPEPPPPPAPAPLPAEPVPTPQPAAKPAAPVAQAQPPRVPAKPVTKAVAKPASTAAEPGYQDDERELLRLPPQQIMVQLLGAESRATADKFRAGAGRGQSLLTYRTQLRGKPWFIVLAGPYPSKDAAHAAIAKMPEALRRQQPWPRSVANVQADIRAHPPRP